jgi:uncharacterized protein (TIGR02996 family)
METRNRPGLACRLVERVAWDTFPPPPHMTRGSAPGTHRYRRYQVTASGEEEPRLGWLTLRRAPAPTMSDRLADAVLGVRPLPRFTASGGVEGGDPDLASLNAALAICPSWRNAESLLCAWLGHTPGVPRAPAHSYLLGQVVLSLRGMTAWSFQCDFIDAWRPVPAGRTPSPDHLLSSFLEGHRRERPPGTHGRIGADAAGHYVLPVTFNGLPLLAHLARGLDSRSRFSAAVNLRVTGFARHAAKVVWACGLGTARDSSPAEDGFATSLLRDPADLAGWKAYADFLMEQDDPGRRRKGSAVARWLELPCGG